MTGRKYYATQLIFYQYARKKANKKNKQTNFILNHAKFSLKLLHGKILEYLFKTI